MEVIDTIENLDAISENIENLDRYINTDIQNINKRYRHKLLFNINTDETLENAHEIAEYIRKNLYDDSFDSKICITDRNTRLNELLTFEFLNLETKKVCRDISEFLSYFRDTVQRYQWRAGGKYIEELEWVTISNTSDMFRIKDGETILLNTIDARYAEDDNTMDFIMYLCRYINRTCVGFSVSNRFIDDNKNDICWIVLKVKKN